MSDLKEHPPVARAAAKALCESVLAGVIEPVRRVARDAGYAIAVHGSVARDIDLVAIPWVEHNVSSPDHLIDRIAAVVASHLGRCNVDRTGDARGWKDMPHGRRAITVMTFSDLIGSVDFDISVMPTKSRRARPMKRLAILAACAALAACAGHTPPPDPTIKTVEVAVPVARSCVPAGVGGRPTDLPATVADMKAKLRAAPDIAARYQMTLDWTAGFIGRSAVTEPVIEGCRDQAP